jgi:hypothetical protein
MITKVLFYKKQRELVTTNWPLFDINNRYHESKGINQ